MWTDPRRRSTSCTVYGRVMPSQRALDFVSRFEAFPLPLPLLPILFSFVAPASPPALVSRLNRIKFPVHDHCFANLACLAKCFRRTQVPPRICQQFRKFFVEQLGDELRCVWHWIARIPEDRNLSAVPHPLRNHQAIDAVGREIFHVAVEQARSPAIQHAVAIANHGSNRSSRSRQRALANVL